MIKSIFPQKWGQNLRMKTGVVIGEKDMSLSRIIYLDIFLKGFLLFLLIYFGCAHKDSIERQIIAIKQKRLTSVRFDPSYYYNTDLEVKELCTELAQQWRETGINTIYIKAYDPNYGAVYQTEYSLNVQTDYGRLDLLRAILDACHQEGIRVYAWIPAFRHKHAWQAHPDWRVKKSDGNDYQPSSDSYFLCVRNPQFRKWWMGFIAELLERYEDLDGIDIAEPIVSWKAEEGCYCALCKEAFKNKNSESDQGKTFKSIRSAPLTSLLEKTCNLIHSHNKSVSITTIVTSYEDGSLFSPEEQRALIGFDLNAVLDAPDKPDIINIELIYQQWANSFGDITTFSPRWTEKATHQMVLQINDRANLVIHVELTPFGKVNVTEEQFLESMRSAIDGGAWGIDFYDSYQADRQGLWPKIRKILNYVSIKKVVIFYDPDGENDAKQLEVLLRHFHTETVLLPLGKNFSSRDHSEIDVIFYLGVAYRKSLPSGFIRYLSRTIKTVCWVNCNLECLGEKNLLKLGLQYKGLDENSRYQIFYKGIGFPKTDSSMNIIHIHDTDKCRVLATAKSKKQEVPYIVRSGHFWYVADLPSSYVVEGGRHIIFADLLHDILREDHEDKHLALVRIEDVHPESDPKSLRAIANFLESKNIPFSVGVTPFYLDPATNTALSLSDKPELVKALHHVISKGGTIVLHGCTHQYRGETTVDYEFWDGLTDQPIFQDSKEYVRDRIEKALNECFKNRIYPLVWETPHYAASLLDYEVIDQFFNTSYERRQTMNISGTDQLLPFLIPAQGGRVQIIPENLGYIPLSDPSADKVVEYARRNLALRDGFASFFFHPFVCLDVLKELVTKIQELGYSFADIRTLNNRVVTPSQVIISGHAEFSIDLKDQYLNEFYLTSKGKAKDHSYSEKKLSGRVDREVVCLPGWMYIARAVDEKEPSFPASIWASVSKSLIGIGGIWQPQPLKAANPPVVPVILIDPNVKGKLFRDQKNFLSAFESVGIDYQTISVSDFLEIPQGTNLVVVPYTAARKLSEQQTLFIVSGLSKGINLILEKESDLSMRIGITPIGEEKKISEVRDEYYPQVNISWKEEGSYRNFEVPIEYVTYYSEKNTGDPVVIGGEYGQGKYLYFTTLFDPTTSMGYGRYPYYLDLIQRQFGLWPAIKRECAEVYFEPGDREDVSIEDLVKMWKKSGFRTIYVAGWHVYPQWTYDYERLIELAHENAMLVYLWLELPHVSEKFWNAHPEWRERTAAGKEAIIDWRRLMALTDKPCREAVFDELSNIIQKYDWDGVNLAELYFESHLDRQTHIPVGPRRPDVFTPMHSSVRESFQAQHGFDPINFFNNSSPHFWQHNAEKWNMFEEFRKDLIVQLHQEFLTFLHQERKQKGDNLEIVVTLIDDIHAKYIGKGTGTDTRRLIALGKELPFALQIEDPAQLWHLEPFRYKSISQTYRPMIMNKDLILDINIVPYRALKISLAPTLQQTGMELNQLLRCALQDSNRVALYSESTIYEVDLPWIAYALGRNAKENFSSHKWKIQSRNTVTLDLDPEQHKDIWVNGQLWPAYYKGKAILPPGIHIIQPVSRLKSLLNMLKTTARLANISGELKFCRMLSRGIEISYVSSMQNYLIINEKPQKVFVDGKLYNAEIYHGISGFSLKLPAGSHTVKIFTRGPVSFLLKNLSIIASVFAVLLSSFAGCVFLVLYITHLRKRRRRNSTGG